jgi:hypothetical protein
MPRKAKFAVGENLVCPFRINHAFSHSLVSLALRAQEGRSAGAGAGARRSQPRQSREQYSRGTHQAPPHLLVVFDPPAPDQQRSHGQFSQRDAQPPTAAKIPGLSGLLLCAASARSRPHRWNGMAVSIPRAAIRLGMSVCRLPVQNWRPSTTDRTGGWVLE